MQGTGSYSFGILEITVDKFFYGKKILNTSINFINNTTTKKHLKE